MLVIRKPAQRSDGYRLTPLTNPAVSLYSYTARHNGHNHVSQIQSDPRFSQSPTNKLVSNCNTVIMSPKHGNNIWFHQLLFAFWVHTYDAQVKLKADSHQSPFVKESVRWALIPHARVVNSLRNCNWLVLIFKSIKSLLLPTMQNASTSKTQN